MTEGWVVHQKIYNKSKVLRVEVMLMLFEGSPTWKFIWGIHLQRSGPFSHLALYSHEDFRDGIGLFIPWHTDIFFPLSLVWKFPLVLKVFSLFLLFALWHTQTLFCCPNSSSPKSHQISVVVLLALWKRPILHI